MTPKNVLYFTLLTFILAGCYQPPTIEVTVPPAEVTVIIDGDTVTAEDEDGDSVSALPVLDITYLGPAPGTGIEPGQCGTLMELEVAVSNGSLDFERTGFTLIANGVAPGSIFSSVTFLVDGITQEDLVNLLPNPTGDTYVFDQNPFTLTNETVVFTYSGCVHTEATIDSSAANIQAVVDYNLWTVGYANSQVEFSEAFQYAHRVNIWAPECPNELILSDLWPYSAFCQGDLTETDTISNGMLIQAEGIDTIYYYHDGVRNPFAYGTALESWYGDSCVLCDEVVRVSNELMATIPLAQTATIKPGSFLVVIGSDPQLYVVDTCKTLRTVTPAMALEIYGANWNSLIRIVTDVFFVDYYMGPPVLNSADYSSATVQTEINEFTCEQP